MTLRPQRRLGEAAWETPPSVAVQWANLVTKLTSMTALIVIAGFLVWKLGVNLDQQTAEMKTMSQQHSASDLKAEATSDMTRRMVVILRVMCVNAARNESDRQNCLQETVR